MANRINRYKGGLVRGRAYKEIGHYNVAHGRHDIEFSLDYPLQTVLVSAPSLDMPVCQGDLNWFSVTLLDRGFVLHADVKTDSAAITWVTVEGYHDDSQAF